MRLEISCVVLRGNRGELTRVLGVIKNIADTSGAHVGRVEATETPVVFNILENAAELVLRVRNVAAPTSRSGDRVR